MTSLRLGWSPFFWPTTTQITSLGPGALSPIKSGVFTLTITNILIIQLTTTESVVRHRGCQQQLYRRPHPQGRRLAPRPATHSRRPPAAPPPAYHSQMHIPPPPVAVAAAAAALAFSTGPPRSTSEHHQVQILLRPPASSRCTTCTHPSLLVPLLRPGRLPQRQTSLLRRNTQRSAAYTTSSHPPTSPRAIDCAR